MAGHFFLAIFLACTLPSRIIAQQSVLPWLESIGAREKTAGIQTISGDASVTVSDGLTYSITTVFHDPQRALWRRVYADRTVTQGVEGLYIWTYEDHVETEALPFVREVILGHQFQAQILFFDRIHHPAGTTKQSRFAGQECMVLESEDVDSPWRFYYDSNGHPLGMEKVRKEQANISFQFDDWRRVSGILLPFTVFIDDGDRKFQYRYSSIKFNEGSMSDLRAPEEVLTDEQKLLRLHRIAMDDHWFGRTAGIRSVRSDSMVILSDGDVYTMTGEEFDAALDRIMKSRDYTVYDDLIRPIVTISEDGTLGWVIAHISAEGIRFDSSGVPNAPLAFVTAWVELYEKAQGQWRLTGNVANFRPGRK